MAKKGFLLLLIIGLLIFVGCDGSTGNPDDVSNEITEEWFSTVANHWMDSDENGIGYVEGVNYTQWKTSIMFFKAQREYISSLVNRA